MSDIRWEDPPLPLKGGWRAWEERLEPLMEQPKRWAIIAVKPTAQNARTTRGNFERGRIKLPPGRWEFVSRTVGDEHRVYARYLGPDEDGDA